MIFTSIRMLWRRVLAYLNFNGMAFSRASVIRHWDNPFAQCRKMLKSLKEIANDARKTKGTDVRSPAQRKESRRTTPRVGFVRLPLASRSRNMPEMAWELLLLKTKKPVSMTLALDEWSVR
jgi:hypothetical protein